MRSPVVIKWEPVTVTGMNLGRDAARIIGPFESCPFATLSLKPSGLWSLRMTPKGSAGPCGFLDFTTRVKAVHHAEQWAAHHGDKLPAWADGLRFNPAAR
jgi:hypothetical protein